MQFTLETVTPVSPTARVLRLRSRSGPVRFEPGQFYRFVFADAAGSFERSYSLANFEAPADVADLLISEVAGGRATRVLWNAGPGLQVGATGPFGKLTLPDPLPRRLILVATSVGLAPYLPMLQALEPRVAAGELRVTLVFGIREPSEFLCPDLLLRLAAQPGFELHVCYSRVKPGQPGVREHAGYVQTVLAGLEPEAAADAVLLCGNPAMVDACRKLLTDMRFPRKRVRHEPYVFAPRIEAKAVTLDAAQKRLIAEKMAKHRRE